MKKELLGIAALAFTSTVTVGCGNLNDVNAALYVRYTDDGHLVVFTGNTIDVYTGDLVKREISLPVDRPSDAISQDTDLFSLSDDGSTAAVIFPNTSHTFVNVFSLSTLTASAIDLGPPAPGQYNYAPEDLALSPGGDRLFVMGGIDGVDRNTGTFDVITGDRLWTGDWAIMPIFSPDGSTLYVSGNHGADLEGLDARTGALTLDVALTTRLERLGAMPDASTLPALSGVGGAPCAAASPCAPAIDVFSTVDGSVTRQFPLQANTELTGNEPLGLPVFRCAPGTGLCVVGVASYDPVTNLAQASEVQVWSMDGTLVQSIETPFSDAAVSPDGELVAVAAGNGDAAVYRVSDGSLVGTRRYGGGPF